MQRLQSKCSVFLDGTLKGCTFSLLLDVGEWGVAKSFDVAAGSTQDISSQYLLTLGMGHTHVHCTYVRRRWIAWGQCFVLPA